MSCIDDFLHDVDFFRLQLEAEHRPLGHLKWTRSSPLQLTFSNGHFCENSIFWTPFYLMPILRIDMTANAIYPIRPSPESTEAAFRESVLSGKCRYGEVAIWGNDLWRVVSITNFSKQGSENSCFIAQQVRVSNVNVRKPTVTEC